MVSFIINLAALVANLKWLLKVIMMTDKNETAKLRQAIKDGTKLAKEHKDPSILSDIINGVK